MTRRLHVPHLHLGNVALPESEAHHARDVLRMDERATVELFDSAGQTAQGPLNFDGQRGAYVVVSELLERGRESIELTIASAVPKGERADWMVEKLSELGVSWFVPLVTDRSVVIPGGTNKHQRWERLAIEAAKQSRRKGVMKIDHLTPVDQAMGTAWYLSTEPGAMPISELVRDRRPTMLRLLIGPEGGWTVSEREKFESAGLTAVRLTDTILRIETAAVAAAAVIMCAAG